MSTPGPQGDDAGSGAGAGADVAVDVDDGVEFPVPAEGEVWAVGAVILDRDGRAFAQRRGPHRRLFPDCWDIVGGHVEAGESLLDAPGSVRKVSSSARRAGPAVSGACSRKAPECPCSGATRAFRQRRESARQTPPARRDFADTTWLARSRRRPAGACAASAASSGSPPGPATTGPVRGTRPTVSSRSTAICAAPPWSRPSTPPTTGSAPATSPA
ncbi:NUDIX domain-containing protein [Streptomyces sp. SID11233]|nr:NUDIX domain-containing protein [Streptomyces sp. SID11233]